MTELYQKVEQFVVDSFTKAGDTGGIRHFKRTVYWIQQLKPDFDEALLIAAIAHDIERAFRKTGYCSRSLEKLRSSLRIWDIEPKYLCRKHLLSEHYELHALWSIIINNKKEILKNGPCSCFS